MTARTNPLTEANPPGKPQQGEDPGADAHVAEADRHIPPTAGAVPLPTVAKDWPATNSASNSGDAHLHMMLKLPPAMAAKLQRAFGASTRNEGRGKNDFVMRLLNQALDSYLSQRGLK